MEAQKARIACEEECRKNLENCNPPGDDKTTCFDELKKCMAACEDIEG